MMMKQSQQPYRIVRFDSEWSGFVIGTHHWSNWNSNSNETKAFSKHSIHLAITSFAISKAWLTLLLQSKMVFINLSTGWKTKRKKASSNAATIQNFTSFSPSKWKSIQFKIWFGVTETSKKRFSSSCSPNPSWCHSVWISVR